MITTARKVFVSGRVQGVGFRWYTQERARELGVHGWVRNLHDGRVEAWIEGAPAAVEAMLEWLSGGPSMARVDALDTSEQEPYEADGFEVRRSGH